MLACCQTCKSTQYEHAYILLELYLDSMNTWDLYMLRSIHEIVCLKVLIFQLQTLKSVTTILTSVVQSP